MPLLALNRKEKRWRIKWHIVRPPPIQPASPANPRSVAVSWPDTVIASRKGGYIAS
jgi:hypothetical protein